MSASPAVQMGFFGPDDPQPYITLDGVDYPLVPGSIVEGAPLNPFSPSNADGNTVAVVSQRHASEVWDDFTGGLGFRDDEPGSHQYALGNLDTRTPSATTLPHKATELGSGAAASLPYSIAGPSAFVPVRADYIGDNVGWGFLTWRWGWSGPSPVTGLVRRVTATGVATVGIPDTENVWGSALWNGNWYILTTVSGVGKLYKSSGTSQTMTFAQVGASFSPSVSLGSYDGKLITSTSGAFVQWDSTSLTWVTYIGGFPDQLVTTENPRQLFVWTDKSGSQDALYALTSERVLVYDEQGQQWETLYRLNDLFWPGEAVAHVNRRDSSLLVTTTVPLSLSPPPALPTGTLLLFTPGTVDNIPINKGFAYPNNSAYNSLGTVAPVNHMAVLASGVHWLYAWCYAPTGLGAGLQGGVFAFNEFGGWTQVFDPCAVRNNTTASVIGGGYGSGRLLTVLSDGSYYVQSEFDMNLNPPFGLYDDQAAGSTHDYFLRSGRVYNKQKNIKKLGSHMEVTFKDPIPTGAIAGKGTVYLRWRYFNENGLSAWVQSALFTAGAQRVSVDLNDGAGSNGIQYYYMEWELHMYMPTATATPPVVESLVLYYTYFQTNKYAYSMNIDLTAETWAEFYPDGNFHGKTREYLQTTLLATMDRTSYHTFTYSQLFFSETVTRADLSLARRESSDDASGVYGLTARDLEADAPAGIFYAG